MTSADTSASVDHSAVRLLPWLLLLFAASGCSALIYEIVWFQLLQLVIGSTAVSISVLLGTYMGGMCIGSLLLPRMIRADRHPLRVYALLELAIGFIGLAVVFGLPHVDTVFGADAGTGLASVFQRGILCALCLLPPTVLMGATLPIIARWVQLTPRGVSWLGLLYGINIGGAVFGCLLAGFYLLRVHDMVVATYVACGFNVGVALLGMILACLAPYETPVIMASGQEKAQAKGQRAVYVAIALSGATALAAEVIWTRLLSLMLGATVYTFSIILAVFLVGLGIGGAVGGLLARVSTRPGLVLGWCQLLLAGAVAWAGYVLAGSLPYWPIDGNLSSNPWLDFQLDLARCCWAILPATCLWGASFPLALAAVPAAGREPGRLVGGVYAANTIGAIVGAVLASLVLVRWLGSQQTERLLVLLSAVSGLCMFVIGPMTSRQRIVSRVLSTVAAVGLAVLLAVCVPAVPWELVAYGRALPSYAQNGAKVLFVGEGMNSSVAVTELENGIRNFHVSGKIEASGEPQDMRLQRMLGHLPALLHHDPKSILVVGCGAGVTAGCFVTHPEVEHIVICEIEPLVPQVVARHFGKENHHVLDDPRVEVVYDDARHYIRTTSRTFDIITSDPIHPWVKGSATLYTTEYFEMCKRHLNPGGVVTQWVPLYESDMDVVRSELATFFQVFADGTVWDNPNEDEGYDTVLLGGDGAVTINVDVLQERLDRPNYAAVRASLEEVGFKHPVDLLGRYGGRAIDLRDWLQGAPINHDRDLRLQYLAGMGLNRHFGAAIRNEIMNRRRYPDGFFLGRGWQAIALRQLLTHPPAKKAETSNHDRAHARAFATP